MRNFRALIDFILEQDETRLESIRKRVLYLLDLAQKIGLTRDHFIPRKYSLTRVYNMILTVLFVQIMYMLHELDVKFGGDKVLQNGSKIVKAIEEFFTSNKDQISLEMYKVTRLGSQKSFKTMYEKLRECVFSKLS